MFTQCSECVLCQIQKTKVGPGTYRIASFTEELEKKPGSLRGICETREKRFKDGKVHNSATRGEQMIAIRKSQKATKGS